MEIFKFLLDNVLGPVFDNDLEWVNGPSRGRIVDDQQQQQQQQSKSSNGEEPPLNKDKQQHTDEDSNQTQGARHPLDPAPGASGDAILDANGLKLVEGVRVWIAIYVFLGHMNLPHAPLYVSIIIKVAITTFSSYIFWTHFLKRYLNERVINGDYTNPIFVLVGLLALLVSIMNLLVIFHMNLFKLSPLFKILTTPKLCFVDQRTQHVFGTSAVKYLLPFFAYQTLLNRMYVHSSLQEFAHQFKLSEFLVEFYSTTVIIYYTIGLSLYDMYIRACFGAWLLALKSNLECRLVRFEGLNMRLDRTVQPGARAASGRSIDGLFRETYPFVSMNEVQKRLNTMDDHLEIWRNVMSSSLVLITLNGFLTCGSILMISYNLLTKSADHYHATIGIMTALNFGLLVMACYMGDSFIRYSLGNFVQTVEDEYFLQDPQREVDELEQLDWLDELQRDANLAATQTESRTPTSSQLFLIKKSDVLFCREFLEQFENHLATPWSKLTFKTHLRMMATFFTLIAAQIIFDSEH